MTKRNIVYLLLTATWCLQSCDDIVEPNLKDEMVHLIAPDSSLVSNTTTNNFWWEPLDGAEEYRLQIVSPSFDSIANLAIDSTTTEEQLAIFLPDGAYEWRVIGMNDAYESLYQTFSLEVRTDTSSNLSNKILGLLSPSLDACTNEANLIFEWTELPQADKYVFQIGDAAFNNLLVNEEVLDDSYAYFLPEEGVYYWRVRAENNNSLTFTPWASTAITLDHTSPVAADLVSPEEEEVIVIADQNPDLIWTSASDAVSDTLLVYADEAASILLLKVAVDSDYNLEDSTYDFNQTDGEDYFWEIISVDKAGNVSDPGELRLFYVEL